MLALFQLTNPLCFLSLLSFKFRYLKAERWKNKRWTSKDRGPRQDLQTRPLWSPESLSLFKFQDTVLRGKGTTGFKAGNTVCKRRKYLRMLILLCPDKYLMCWGLSSQSVVCRQAAQVSARSSSEVQNPGLYPDLWIRMCSLPNPQVIGILSEIMKQCYNGFHLGGELFKADHLESFLDHASLTRSNWYMWVSRDSS